MPSYVIAGGGLAAAKAAETLRDEGFDGEIVLLGSEPERPYERPPLSRPPESSPATPAPRATLPPPPAHPAGPTNPNHIAHLA